MKIRHATLQDYDRIMEMMINFANSSPFESLQQPDFNDMYIRKLLDSFLKNGVILLGEREDKIQGMLIAQIIPDVWLPHITSLREIAWWVEPEARMSSMGYRLLKEYVKVGEKLQEKDIIKGFTLTNMEISPDFNLEKRGWAPIETNYIYEGV
tara:strand:+ start:6344 stop:6802 length:459 start_codon:yes stop_codon:yes gene_type:complete